GGRVGSIAGHAGHDRTRIIELACDRTQGYSRIHVRLAEQKRAAVDDPVRIRNQRDREMLLVLRGLRMVENLTHQVESRVGTHPTDDADHLLFVCHPRDAKMEVVWSGNLPGQAWNDAARRKIVAKP